MTLEDCLIWTEPAGLGDFHIVFSLPGEINCYGIKSSINNYKMGHENFPNQYGTISIACDFCVRYFPQETELQQHQNRFDFRSLDGWPEFKGNKFMVSRLNSKTVKILETDDKDLIIAKIERYKNLRQFLDSFFGWLNESIRQYGELFYKPSH